MKELIPLEIVEQKILLAPARFSPVLAGLSSPVLAG